jgi:hypothetical protein
MKEICADQLDEVSGGFVKFIAETLAAYAIEKALDAVIRSAPSGEPIRELEYLNGYHAA